MKSLLLNRSSSIWASLLLNAFLSQAAFSATILLSLTVEQGTLPNLSVSNTSAAIGGSNWIGVPASLGIGIGNQQYSGSCTLLIGEHNVANPSYSGLAVGIYNELYSSYSIIGGGYNFVSGYANFVMGGFNYIFEDPVTGGSGGNGVFGQSNETTNGVNCLIVGQSNELQNSTTDSAAVGRGLLVSSGAASLVVVGQYNATPATEARFVVGNGSYDYTTYVADRRNAFAVYQNGDASVSGVLRVPKAGDIPMFGSP